MKTTHRPLALFVALLLLSAAPVFAGPLDNCQEYVKYGVPSERGALLCRKGYALAHNQANKTPDWVAERLTKEKAEAVMDRSNDFRPDPDLPVGERAELSDYKGSGFDRGHMAPAGDMRWDEQAMSESFYLSNMAPQVGVGMNRGIWKNLEEKIRAWAIKRGELYIFTGPIYDTADPVATVGGNQVAVPTHFYKVIFDPVRVDAIAFIMPNEKLNTADMPNYVVSVAEVEAKTGLLFLGTIEEAVRQLVKSRKAAGVWE